MKTLVAAALAGGLALMAAGARAQDSEKPGDRFGVLVGGISPRGSLTKNGISKNGAVFSLQARLPGVEAQLNPEYGKPGVDLDWARVSGHGSKTTGIGLALVERVPLRHADSRPNAPYFKFGLGFAHVDTSLRVGVVQNGQIVFHTITGKKSKVYFKGAFGQPLGNNAMVELGYMNFGSALGASPAGFYLGAGVRF